MKKLVSLLMALAMLLSVMSFAAAEEEPFVLTVMLPDHYPTVDFQAEDNPVLKAIEEATGVRLEIIWAANSTYNDTLNTTLTDEVLPNIISMPDARSTTMINNARAGAFYDLTDYVKDTETYPNLAGVESIYNNISIDGRIYGIYRTRAFPRAGIYYRTDIAKEVGFDKEVKTLDDLTELATALAGYSEDTYALNMCSYTAGTINLITVAHGAPNTWGINENGEVYPAHEHPAYLEGLNWLRNLYSIGGIDPNFATIDATQWDNIERTGKAFMRFDCMDNGYRQQEWFEKNAGVTEQIFEICGPIAKADGTVSVWPQNAGFSGEIVVTKSVKEEDLPKVMKFLDWVNGAEGQMLINWGLADVTYWLDADGYRLVNPESGEDMSLQVQTIQHSLNQLGMNLPGDLAIPAKVTGVTDLRNRYNALNLELAPYAVGDPCYPFVSETNVAFGSQLNTIISDAAVQYIAGIIDEDGLRAAWQQWSDEGGAIIAQEYTEAYQATLK